MYMDSNDPYQRVGQESSMLPMLAAGTMSGLASTGAVHGGLALNDKLLERSLVKSGMVKGDGFMMTNNLQGNKKAMKKYDRYTQGKMQKARVGAFGGGWRKTLSYGAGALLGGAVGAGYSAWGD